MSTWTSTRLGRHYKFLQGTLHLKSTANTASIPNEVFYQQRWKKDEGDKRWIGNQFGRGFGHSSVCYLSLTTIVAFICNGDYHSQIIRFVEFLNKIFIADFIEGKCKVSKLPTSARSMLFSNVQMWTLAIQMPNNPTKQ